MHTAEEYNFGAGVHRTLDHSQDLHDPHSQAQLGSHNQFFGGRGQFEEDDNFFKNQLDADLQARALQQ